MLLERPQAPPAKYPRERYRRSAPRRLETVIPWLLAITGCGGGAATLHPAHVLPLGRMSLGAGVSHQFVGGDAGGAIESTVSKEPASRTLDAPAERIRFAQAVAASTLLTPGLSPWVGARVGVGRTTEGGLTFTGRTVRADLRHAFQNDQYALSIGLGGSGKISPSGGTNPVSSSRDSAGVSGLDTTSVRGFGVDIPVLAGWRSSGDVVQAWCGLRAGYELLAGTVGIQAGVLEPLSGSFDAHRYYAGGVVGLAVGLSPIWVAIELNGAYHSGTGSLDTAGPLNPFSASASLSGLTLSPTGALVTRF